MQVEYGKSTFSATQKRHRHYGIACSKEMGLDQIEIFKTNVLEVKHAKFLVEIILDHFPSSRVNFALDDCDKILRVQGQGICPEKIIKLLNSNGYKAEVLS